MHTELIKNDGGSEARDFCMLERNLLSHLKLALLLSVLSSSLLLHTRLVPGKEEQHDDSSGIPLACVQFAAAIAAIVAGAREYYTGYWNVKKAKALLATDKPYLIIVSCVAGVVFGSCLVLLVQQG